MTIRNLDSMFRPRSVALFGASDEPGSVGAAGNVEEVRTAAERILQEHPACVLKILSDDISHKSDVGGVRLDIGTAERAARLAEEMLERVRESRPDAQIDGIGVQPMLRSKLAHELIAGMTEDPTFGPVMMSGAGHGRGGGEGHRNAPRSR